MLINQYEDEYGYYVWDFEDGVEVIAKECLTDDDVTEYEFEVWVEYEFYGWILPNGTDYMNWIEMFDDGVNPIAARYFETESECVRSQA